MERRLLKPRIRDVLVPARDLHDVHSSDAPQELGDTRVARQANILPRQNGRGIGRIERALGAARDAGDHRLAIDVFGALERAPRPFPAWRSPESTLAAGSGGGRQRHDGRRRRGGVDRLGIARGSPASAAAFCASSWAVSPSITVWTSASSGGWLARYPL